MFMCFVLKYALLHYKVYSTVLIIPCLSLRRHWAIGIVSISYFGFFIVMVPYR